MDFSLLMRFESDFFNTLYCYAYLLRSLLLFFVAQPLVEKGVE